MNQIRTLKVENEGQVRQAIAAAERANGNNLVTPEVVPNSESPKEAIVLQISENGTRAIVHMPDNLEYELNHPGIRKVIQWREESIKYGEKSFNVTSLDQADKFFEDCVKPEGHSFKPTVDNIDPNNPNKPNMFLYDCWTIIRMKFLEGNLADG